MSKTEERLRNLLEDHSNKLLDKHMNEVNQKRTTILLSGFILGIIFAYSGILGFCVGLIIGIFIANSFKYNPMIQKITDVISQFWNQSIEYLYKKNE